MSPLAGPQRRGRAHEWLPRSACRAGLDLGDFAYQDVKSAAVPLQEHPSRSEARMLTRSAAKPGSSYTPGSSSITPVDSDERLHSLDILRGFALLFMILVHFHQRLRAEGSTGIQDLIGWGVWIFVEQKAWGVFAFLFGAGFTLFLRRLEARGTPVVRIYLRRLATLAGIGLLVQWLLGFHILFAYALWGLALLAMRHWSTKALLVAAILAAAARPSVAAAMALAAHSAGVAPGRPGAWWRVVPDSNLALVLVGLLAVRYRVLDEPLRHARLIRMWMIGGAAAWAVSWLVLYHVPNDLPVRGLAWPLRAGLGLVHDQWLCFTYVGAVILSLAYRPRLVARLARVGTAGRMALTNYVAQATVIFMLSTPPGVRIREAAYVGATLVLFGVLAVFSNVWLSHYRFGPLEWVWRMASYARWEPLRRPERAVAGRLAV